MKRFRVEYRDGEVYALVCAKSTKEAIEKFLRGECNCVLNAKKLRKRFVKAIPIRNEEDNEEKVGGSV